MKRNVYRILAILLIVFATISCKEDKTDPTPIELIQGVWKVDRGFHIDPDPTEFYVQYDVAIIGNKWQQFDLDSPYYFNLIGDTLYLNEYGYVKRFYIQELTESSFTLVFTDTDVSTEPVHTYVGSR